LRACCFPGVRTRRELDAEGQPILRPKYGFHCLRHFFASWLLAEGFSLKKAQGLLRHDTMAMTANTYGHLLPDLENDAAKMAAANWRSRGRRQTVGSSSTGGHQCLDR
jgi:integrase